MNLTEHALYREDLKRCLEKIPHIGELAGSRILVTGATGLICSAIVDMLAEAGLGCRLLLAGRDREKCLERFGPDVRFIPYDATREISFDFPVDYIIHGAGNASPDLYTSQPVETMTANMLGISQLLDYAGAFKVKKIIYISSSEVYGQKTDPRPFGEEDYGFVDLLSPRSSYAAAKRAAETLCASYFHEYGVPFNTVRPGHIYGPGAAKQDRRISSAFAYLAAKGEDLVMKSPGRQMRSYCYSPDCASAILTVMLGGRPGEAYNISNSRSMITIRTMAEIMAREGGSRLLAGYPSEDERQAFNPMDNSALNSDKLEGLGWEGVFDAEEGLRHTVAILRDCQ